MTAVLVNDVAHGSLSLQGDGAFTYTPAVGFIGVDSFSYKTQYGAQETNTVTVTLTVTGPTITLSTAAISATCLHGQDAAAQSFTVRNSGAVTLEYTISDDAAWLSCSPASGSSTGESDTIAVSYDTDALPPGTYTATITVASADASNSPQTIAVTLTVTPPHLVRSTATLSPSCLRGANASSQTFTVRNSVGGTMTYTISDNVAWLGCDPVSGDSTGDTDTITVSYDTAGLVAGTYSATITVTSPEADNSPQTIAVTLTVTPPHLVLNKTTLSPSCLQGVNAANQTFTVRNSTGGALTYTISDNVAWLGCDPVSGDSTGETDTITVSYDTAGMAPGTYDATITVTSPEADNGPLTIAVTLTVAGPHLMLSTATLSPTCTQGANAADQAFTVRNSGGATLNYTISDDVAWLACDPISGDSTGEVDSITVHYDAGALAPGTYNAVITVTSADADNSPRTIAVTLTVTTPHMVLNKTTLSQSCLQGADATAQTFTVRNSSPGTMNYTVSDDAGWLACTPDSGDSAGEADTITVSYDTDALAPGTYNATITVAAASADNSPQTIAVTLTVVGPHLVLNKTTLDPTCLVGANPAATTFTVCNFGGGTMAYTISDDVAWLACDPTSGDSAGETDTIAVTYDASALTAGTYEATITVTAPDADNSPRLIAVTLTVAQPPAIGLAPAALSYTATVGLNPASQAVSVTNSGGTTLAWTASGNKPWLQVSPTWGTTTTETDTLTVSAVVSQGEAWTTATSTAGAPGARRKFSAVWTGKEVIVWGGLDSGNHVTGTSGRYDPATDAWSGSISTTGAPSARNMHSAVWTGREMIIWGGDTGGPGSETATNSGARYNPVTDTWSSMSTTNAPSARWAHGAVWTGTEMIVWGGCQGTGPWTFLSDGARYDPATDTWAPMTNTGAPSAREEHSAVWTGSEMIIWGGWQGSSAYGTGARYDPATDSWTGTVSTTNAPSGRSSHEAVWTGSEMIVWGGCPQSGYTDTGARYDPVSNSWLGATAVNGALSARRDHQMVWTGKELVAWGGYDGSVLATGKRYRPPLSLAVGTYTGTVTVTDPIATNNPQAVTVTLEVVKPTIGLAPATMDFSTTKGTNPAAQSASVTNPGVGTLAWTASGNKPWLQVSPTWGTTTTETDTLTVSAVVSQAEAWTGTTTTTGAPVGREDQSAVWTGKEMIVWGGRTSMGGAPVTSGGRYDPVTNTWTGGITTVGGPEGRRCHSAVWTGKEMIIWGGYVAGDAMVNTGYRYDPALDSWSNAVSTVNAPAARRFHAAVWTGTEMILWSGHDGSGVVNTGARYNPVTDTWTAMSTTNAPSARLHSRAVWTGTEMIVWGGHNGTNPVNTGGRYNPATDTWTGTVSTTGAPDARLAHSAAWAGSEMIVWGGSNAANTGNVVTGGRYNPTTDSWSAATSTTGTPTGRRSHTAVWTGTEMIVWGGGDGGYLNTGARYRPPISLSPGTYTGTVTVADPNASNSPQTVAVTLTVSNQVPEISSFSPDDPATVAVGATQAFAVDVWDPDDDTLSYAWKIDGDNVPVAVNTMNYSPLRADIGDHTITVTVSDGRGGTVTQTWTVHVPNAVPVANDQSVTTAEDTPKAITLTASDADDDPLTYTVVAGPAHGALTGTAPALTYTPTANWNGSDSFTFKVNDGRADSAEATVSITVTAVNDAPVADAQAVTTAEDTPKDITLTGSDVEGSDLTFTVVTAPAHGTLTGTAPALTYTPEANWNGSDSFTFKVNDGTADSTPATVPVTVTAANDTPVANAQAVTTAEDTPKAITLTGSDVEGSALTFTVVSAPAHGTLSGSGASRTYTPAANWNGSDSFTFKVNDGTVDSTEATVSITVTAVNDVPVADAQAVTTDEDTPGDV
ncbi:MAG TPA: Ig-like domain-containing protein, partial [Planctomycetota bacterium]|nr:Ig-like domain-containing protein [Planctomycetota bacterium]